MTYDERIKKLEEDNKQIHMTLGKAFSLVADHLRSHTKAVDDFKKILESTK